MNLRKGIEDLLRQADEEENKPETEEVEEKTEVEEKVEEKPEELGLKTFDEQMDFLAKDEQEAIDGYEKVLPLIDDEHVKEQLQKILDEEKAHKEYLDKVKADHTINYEEPKGE